MISKLHHFLTQSENLVRQLHDPFHLMTFNKKKEKTSIEAACFYCETVVYNEVLVAVHDSLDMPKVQTWF